MRRRIATVALAVFALAPRAGLAAAPGDPVVAARRSGEIVLDGRLEEPGWDAAPVHDGFVQQFPEEGAPPSERTEVRVLYDDRALYVGILAHDGRSGEVNRTLGRRDSQPPSDAVTVVIDSMHDRRTAFVFELNAAGVQTDGLLFQDDQFSADWDAVWDGAAAAVPDGWSAELVIPLSVLRFSDRPGLTFGFGVKRVIPRRHETDLSVLIPRSARGQVARLGELVGLEGLKPVRAFELLPYVAARASLRPRATDGDPPRPRVAEPAGDVGLDLRTSVGRGLTLQATLNPDFGQVEADEIIQNLSTFEAFFPEKRPFFTQGMDLFQPVAPPGRPSTQQLFYSRRIGLDAPILGAAKLSGKASRDVQVGVVEAFVAGAGAGGMEDDPPRAFRFEPAQPLRFGPASALPTLAPASRNFAAGVVRWRPTPQAALGATATSTLPVGPACTPAEADRLPLADLPAPGDAAAARPLRCDALAGNAAAADFSLRTRDGEWFALGQVVGSQSLGGPPVRTLPDGTALARGDLGVGALAAAGRQGGEPWRWELQWEYQSPKLELNAAGYLRTQNEQLGRALVRYVRPKGGGPFHGYALQVGAEGRWTTDGRGLRRGGQAWFISEFQLRSFHWFGCNAVLDAPRWDVREIDQAGVALERPAAIWGECWLSSDVSRPLFVDAGVGAGRALRQGPLAPLRYAGAVGRFVLRPHARLETRVDARLEWNAWRARWVDSQPDPATGEPSHLFADLTAPALSITLRQAVVLTRRLTLQAYAQLFTSYGRYGAFWQAAARDGVVRSSDLKPRDRPGGGDPAFAALGDPEFRSGALSVNAVLRWEYRLGSTFFLVYTRAQREPEWDGGGPAPRTLRPWELGTGPITDAILVKWSHWWSR
ncbi:MAG TPA: DUF5916 domain-containing protein [Anaeromyxobacter sp.]|nr:DUF5916 domain-containing protein [Anaeromyxobacter sp.]